MIPANEPPAARDDAAADFAPQHTDSRNDWPPPGRPSAADEVAAVDPFPWPPRAGESAIAALGRTWRDVMFSPASFYRRMPADATLGPAVIYFLIMGVLSSGITLFWEMLALALLPPVASDSMWSIFVPANPGDALISFFFAPLFLLAILFIGAAITHALLKLMSAAGHRYGATVRVVAYVQSVGLLAIVPFAGAFVGAFWALVLTIIGLREVHRTTTAKAAIALLLPVFAVFFSMFMLLVLFVMGAAMLT